jgi:tRNA threonylcarbamoyladenosine biosynthesis protein TsaE
MRIISRSESSTLRIGRVIGKNLKRGDILCLFGELGSGKTVLVKGIASGLGIRMFKVISPTFVLIREYLEGRFALYHFDLYRLKKEQDILGLGYEEYLDKDGVVVIEWADRLNYLLPKEFLKIKLSIRSDRERKIEIFPFGRHHRDLLKKIHADISH